MSRTSLEWLSSAAAGTWPGHPKSKNLKAERKVPLIFLIIEWPSKDVAKSFYECDEYRPHRQSRIEGAKSEFLLVAGEDMTKTAEIAD